MTPTPNEEFIQIADMTAWNAFWRDNAECLAEDYGDEAICLELARRGKLLVGGGAAPLFRVGFATALDRAIEAIETATVPASAIRAMHELRRKSIRRFANDCTSCSHEAAMVKLAWPLFTSFFSTDDAVVVLARAYRVQRRAQRNRHWSYDHNRLAALRERLTVARYLRRFSRQVWLDRRAAA